MDFVDSSLCSFPVETSATADIDDLLFFDPAGNLVRIHETVNHVSFVYSADGKSLAAKGSGGIDITLNPDGTQTASTFGINLVLTIPHEGNVFLDVGHAVYLFGAGPPQLLFHAGPASYDLDAFCAALTA